MSRSRWLTGILSGGLSELIGLASKGGEEAGGGAWFQKTFGQGSTPFEKEQWNYNKEFSERQWNRDSQWRDADLAREERYRAEDITREHAYRQEDLERNTAAWKMQDAKAAGLHTATVMGGFGGAQQMGQTMKTSSGGRISQPRAQAPSAPASGVGSPLELLSAISHARVDQANARLLNAEAENYEKNNEWLDTVVPGQSYTYRMAEIMHDYRLTEQEIEEFNLALDRLRHDNRILLQNPNLLTDSRDIEHFINDLRRNLTALNVTEYTIDKITDIVGKFFGGAGTAAVERHSTTTVRGTSRQTR